MMSINVWDDWMNRQANDQVFRFALGQLGESLGETVFHFLMRRYETTLGNGRPCDEIRATYGFGPVGRRSRRFRHRRNPEAVRSAICAACTNTKSNCRLERTTAEMTAKSKSPFVMRCIVFSVFASIIEEWFTSIAFWICLWFCLPHYCGVICKYCLLC